VLVDPAVADGAQVVLLAAPVTPPPETHEEHDTGADEQSDEHVHASCPNGGPIASTGRLTEAAPVAWRTVRACLTDAVEGATL
jgi:hypothetical protein